MKKFKDRLGIRKQSPEKSEFQKSFGTVFIKTSKVTAIKRNGIPIRELRWAFLKNTVFCGIAGVLMINDQGFRLFYVDHVGQFQS
jgi:hypothetical protein